MERIRIAPGVYLNRMATDRFHSDYVSLRFLLPLRERDAALHSLLPYVLRRGCAPYPTLAALTERLQMLYDARLAASASGRRGEIQLLTQSAWMLDGSVAPAGEDIFGETLAVMRDLWFSPLTENGVFREDYTESEKKTLTDAIRSRINDKSVYAAMRCRRVMCQREAYGASTLGREEDAAAADPAALTKVHRRVLTDAPCEIFCIGRGDADRTARLFADAFGAWPRTENPFPKTEVIRSAPRVRHVTDKMDVRQGRLSVGFRLGLTEADGCRPLLLMLNEIYGASPTSKLFMNVREKLGLCYDCSSAADWLKGVMFVHCGIADGKRRAAEEAILHQLDEIREGRITVSELDAARRSIRSALRSLSDGPDSIESWHLGRRLAGQETTVEEEIERVMAVTRGEVAEAARRVTADTVYFLSGTEAGKAGGDDEEA